MPLNEASHIFAHLGKLAVEDPGTVNASANGRGYAISGSENCDRSRDRG